MVKVNTLVPKWSNLNDIRGLMYVMRHDEDFETIMVYDETTMEPVDHHTD